MGYGEGQEIIKMDCDNYMIPKFTKVMMDVFEFESFIFDLDVSKINYFDDEFITPQNLLNDFSFSSSLYIENVKDDDFKVLVEVLNYFKIKEFNIHDSD